jgi:ring-1,2-phenylacetyl-CoA epoxidase subunit PaaC
MRILLDEATLNVPADSAFLSNGKCGVHSEHMGFILTQMQYLQRAYPGGVW